MFLGTPFDLDEPIKREIDVLIDREFIYRDDSDEYVVSFPSISQRFVDLCGLRLFCIIVFTLFAIIGCFFWLEEMLISYSCFVSILQNQPPLFADSFVHSSPSQPTNKKNNSITEKMAHNF